MTSGCMPAGPPAPMGQDVSHSYRGLLIECIARQLEHDIRSGEIKVGTKLPSEREPAAQFGASRNVVREALRRLEARHLIGPR
ncbi:winged helix-turn-helix domain-containing protein [Nonomuraea sp. 10N515B]|uniref:winged helix-turn-helix domain-containing protein n=1 Tax=Nonomuraea sp. 10N515B TaxID=3457422 RepID=UPI003FCDE12F